MADTFKFRSTDTSDGDALDGGAGNDYLWASSDADVLLGDSGDSGASDSIWIDLGYEIRIDTAATNFDAVFDAV